MHDWRSLAVLAALLCGPASGAGLEVFHSQLLNRDVPIAVHVPTRATVDRWQSLFPGPPLRLVLFLPGAYDGPEDFLQSGLEGFLSDQESMGTLPPSLWVAVTHFQSWYANRADGSFPYERFLREELIPFLEAEHPAFGGSPAARSVAGLSMGGFGALNLAAHGGYSRCLALSPALVEPPFRQVNWFVRWSLTHTFSTDPILFAPWNPWKHLGGEAELVVGCGTEDKYGLAEACRAFAKVCRERKRPLRLDLRPGGHDWAYWTPAFKAWAPWLLGLDDSLSKDQTAVAGKPIGPMIGP